MMMKRLIVLFFCLLLAALPACASAAELRPGVYDRKADPKTIDSWKDFFGEGVKDTHNAGEIWTDKSVYTADSINTKLPEWTNIPSQLIADTGDNFLVALSALSANKAIVGRETIPTDTIFVLDISSSMYDGDSVRNPEAVQRMMNAVNAAIVNLHNLNVANRVGIVLYNGYSSVDKQSDSTYGFTLLPLDRYTYDNETIATVSTDSDNKLSSIQLHTSVKKAWGNHEVPVFAGWTNPGTAGTFAQRGIQLASDMFEAATTVVTAAEDPYQEGRHRMPIIILMTDGLPTAATKDFSNVIDAQWGNNANDVRSDAESDFVTQLTASLVKEKMARHYDGRTPLFYTLGLGTNETLAMDILDPKGQDDQYAGETAEDYSIYTGRADLYDDDCKLDDNDYFNSPASVNRKIDEYWRELVDDGKVSFNALVWSDWDIAGWRNNKPFDVVKGSAQGTVGSTKEEYNIANFPTSVDQKYYVDRAFNSEESKNLTNVFKNIVREIEIQSAYYPTEVLEDPALDGYLTFVDDIGEHMHVRSVKGIVSADVFYSGRMFAETVQKGIAGDEEYQGTYQDILKALSVRLNENDLTAVDALLRAAVAAGDIKAGTGNGSDFENKIVWYATYNESTHTVSYMPYEDMTANQDITDTAERIKANYSHYAPGRGNKPDNAKYRIASYSFGGHDQQHSQAQDWLYGFLRVAEDLENGRKFVDWRVPASLIPLVKYKVTLENSDLDNPGEITLERTAAKPIHALYEVALDPQINVYNVADIVEEVPGRNYDQQDGSYIFYSNDWQWNGNESSLNQFDYATPGQVKNTVAWFTPNRDNERYYTSRDLDLYVRDGDGHAKYYGGIEPAESGETFYVRHDVYAVGSWADGKEATVTHDYDRCEHGLEAAVKNGSSWYIPAETVHPITPAGDHPPKEPNTTDTLPYVHFTAVRQPEQDDHDHTHDYFGINTLGNNGVLRLKPAVPGGSKTVVYYAHEHEAVVGRPLGGDVFTFELYRADENYACTGEALQTVACDSEGRFVFDVSSLDVTQSGRYVVIEKAGGAAGMTYDPAQYRIAITVDEGRVSHTVSRYVMDGSGEYVRDSAWQGDLNAMNFQNEYRPEAKPLSVMLRAQKSVTGSSKLDGYRFTLSLVNGGEEERLDTAVSDSSGRVSFEPITYTEKDAGQTFTYRISEVKESDPSRPGDIIYDETVHTVTVAARLQETHTGTYEVVCDVSYDSREAEFTNKTTLTPSAVIKARKTLDGKVPPADAFAFYLKDYESGAVLQTKRNDAEGRVLFDPIQYDETGEYRYLLGEAFDGEATKAGQILHDASRYLVTVTVAKAEGTAANDYRDLFLAQTVYELLDESGRPTGTRFEQGPTFANETVALSQAAHIRLQAKKLFDGKTPSANQAGSFTFALLDGTTGDVMQTAVNGKEGRIDFEPIRIQEAGKYSYVICEVIPEKPENLIYDTTMYLASVTVTSRLEGSQEILTVSPVTYTHLDAKGAEIGKPDTAEPVFNNLKMPDIPKTGDDTNLAALVVLMTASGLLALALRRRKRA